MTEQEFLPYNRPDIGEEEVAEVAAVLRSGWLVSGPRVRRFEEEFREYTGASHAVAVASCTAGLHLALLACDVGPGDEVITTPLTFAATVNVIEHVGATPVLADVSPDDWNLDPAQVARKISPRTKAIIPVHFAGQPCREDEIAALAREHGLRVIEDAAHSLGGQYKGRTVGTFGDATAFSFYATKNITTGQGGMVTTDDAGIAERVRLLTLHGLSHQAWDRYSQGGGWYYEVLAPGFNYTMTDIQAAMGVHQMARLEGFLRRRRELASLYESLLSEAPAVSLPVERGDVIHSWHLYVIKLRTEMLNVDRAEFIRELNARGIGTSVHFIPIHYHPYYRERLGVRKGDLPVAEEAFEGFVSLPLYPRMSDGDVERVVAAVSDIASRHGKA